MYTIKSPLCLILMLLLGSFSAYSLAGESDSQSATAKPAKQLEPLPPPPALDGSDDNEPEVTITRKTDQTIEEYRVGGRLYMIKVTPKVGPPYYLVDDRGDGKFSRQESLDTGFRVPRWVIKKF